MEGAENLQAFQELISKEERGEICPTFASNGGIGSTMAGVTGVAGVATAVGGQAALWAVASAFGTTAGGTAIGTLVGIAETNAFLAWLGGGAIAAGGGGVAVGSAVFAAIPIIGWAVALIGTSIAAITITKNRRKNEETIRKVQETVRQLSTMTKKQTKEMNKASQIINTLIAKRAYLNHSFFTSYPMDCMDFSTDQKEYLLDCCHIYIELCHNINESIAK